MNLSRHYSFPTAEIVGSQAGCQKKWQFEPPSMKNMNRYLYQLRITHKYIDAKVVLFIIYSKSVAETFSNEALPVELHLLFVMVRTATFSGNQP